ncbi:MAG TPA: acetate--CoA ligase family protein, partial [Streptosporangiaceae bacterium]|nr:acetate--CoA ligase family protein [Streptosporangiaceae bacterium]
SAKGKRLAAGRSPATVPRPLTRQALFEQAGVIATANLGELLDAAALLASQPLPAGNRVGVVSNTRGALILAADACGDAGLQVAGLTADTQRELRDVLPPGADVAGPVDTRGLVAPGRFRRCLELVGADPGIDAVLALTATTAISDLAPEVHAARLPVPIAAVVMDQVETVRLLPGPDEASPPVPAYAYPESAVRALGHAARYSTWRATPPGRVPGLDGLRQDQAAELAAGFLAGTPHGGWLSREQTAELLGCYGVPLASSIAVTTEETAAAAAARIGGPVMLTAEVPSLARNSDAGIVLPDLHSAEDVRRAFCSLQETFGDRLAAVIVQPMTGGTEVTISVLQEQMFGPLVLIGPGQAPGALADHAARIAPLTDADADTLIRSIRAAPRLLGRHSAAADLAALRDILLRVSQMADDLPHIAELELSPVIARPDGVRALDARIRIQPAEPADAYLRRLE